MTNTSARLCVARLWLAGTALFGLVSLGATAGDAVFESSPLRAPEPIVRMQADIDGGLLAVSAKGVLWRLDPETIAWARLGNGIDGDTPLASGHGRIAARGALGDLWVWEGGRATLSRGVRLAPHAGLLVLPLGIIGVAQIAGSAHAVRLEPDNAGGWTETARSVGPVLPDARPFQTDLESGHDAGGGHIIVLAGPDDRRYKHGVLGDAIESTRVLYLERHDLKVLRSLDISAPHVIEDIAPRPVVWRGRTGLLTMRSGPQGAQLAVVAASTDASDRLEFAALGTPLGMPNRWLAGTTDGKRLLAVHTPHIGGVLHEYRTESATLSARAIAEGVSNHHIGSRELDLAVWLGARLMLPAADRTSLRCFDADAGWSACGSVPLGKPAIASAKLSLRGRGGFAVLTADGQLIIVSPRR